MELSSPFVAWKWNEPCNLAGAVWRPVAQAGLIGINIKSGRLFTQDALSVRGFSTFGCLYPLLPSPDWINAQANPREVAIAALERAGFHNLGNDFCYISWNSEIIDQWRYELRIGIRPEGCEFGGVTRDPVLARYAVDCFTVLHEWASNVKWEASNGTE